MINVEVVRGFVSDELFVEVRHIEDDSDEWFDVYADNGKRDCHHICDDEQSAIAVYEDIVNNGITIVEEMPAVDTWDIVEQFPVDDDYSITE